MRKIIITFRMALRDARANVFHTLLSVLGIVIGVAALVGILSLIDGMEQYAHRQIARTTSIESVIITTKTTEKIDNVLLTKEDYAFFDYDRFTTLQTSLGDKAVGYMLYRESGYLNAADSIKRKGTLFAGIIDTQDEDIKLKQGRFITKEDLINKDSVIVLNTVVANHLSGDSTKSMLDEWVTYNNGNYKVVGVLIARSKEPEVYVPITLIPESQLKAKPPMCLLKAKDVTAVPLVKEAVQTWIKENMAGHESDFSVVTNEFRVKQANQGFLVFRIVMGMIVGISVLVGGIGVMNVLLISVTERTTEIGVRKAVGAKPKDIIIQFLSESITISAIGSLMGLILGILFTMVAVPIVKHFTKMPFEAAYTVDTLITITLVSLLVGVVFGTYPALKAAKLDPVEAMRRE